MSSPTTAYACGADGVAVLTLTHPPVNALHPAVLTSLFESLQRAHADANVKAVVVTGSGKNFSAGFDINQFQKSGGGGISNNINDAICALLESGPKPTVAAIQGVAMGGGLEVAMGCNARVCAHGARLGLPELSLGIIPGFGGTQRLPRLVGLQKAIEMMLTSTPIKHDEALKLGLVDELVPVDQLLTVAKAHALALAQGRRARLASLFRSDKLEPYAEALAVIEFARAEAKKRARHLTHPQLCLNAIQTGVEQGGLAGLTAEAEAFAASAALSTHAALVHMFFAQRSTKRVRGVTDSGLTPRQLQRVAVLGGGLMGSGIATACLLAGMHVTLKEVNNKFLEAGVARVRANMSSRVKKGRMSTAAMDAAMARLTPTLEYDTFGNVDIVIEAVIEDVQLKQRIFADLERYCSPQCILSSNTSTIDITLLGAKTNSHDRIVGAHFFSPAHVMPLLEIVRTQHTSKQVVLDTLELAGRIKKTPVVVGNCTGFAVNRVFFPYTMAACLLVDLGVNPYLVDKAIGGTFGMPMGPFRLNDLVGSDIGLHVGKNFVESYPERVYVSSLIPLLNQQGRLGEKSGKGFYQYDAKRRASPDPAVRTLIEESVRNAGLLPAGTAPPRMTDQEIIEIIFYPVVNEACRVVAEGIVDKPADMDVASVLAMGFPPYRGGLLFWADLVGAASIARKLDDLASRFGPKLAGFFKPCDYLRQCAQSGRKLGDGLSQSKL